MNQGKCLCAFVWLLKNIDSGSPSNKRSSGRVEGKEARKKSSQWGTSVQQISRFFSFRSVWNPNILPPCVSDHFLCLSRQTRRWSSTCSAASCPESCPLLWPTPLTSSRWPSMLGSGLGSRCPYQYSDQNNQRPLILIQCFCHSEHSMSSCAAFESLRSSCDVQPCVLVCCLCVCSCSRSECRRRAVCSKAAWCPTSWTSTRPRAPEGCGGSVLLYFTWCPFALLKALLDLVISFVGLIFLLVLLRVSSPQHSEQPLWSGWNFLSTTSRRSTSFNQDKWETPLWRISCRFKLLQTPRSCMSAPFLSVHPVAVCAVRVSRAAWPGRWRPTPWTWCAPVWWTSGFRRGPPCTKAPWTGWCRRGRTRASSLSIRGSGPTGCGWGLGTSSYPSQDDTNTHWTIEM